MFLIWAFLGTLVAVSSCSEAPTVTISQGTLAGKYLETVDKRQISSFLGVPYAKPPVGKHRFKESIPPSPWVGIYNATQDADVCLQVNHLLLDKGFALRGSEDCLYLNVHTPKLPSQIKDGKLLDVIFYIHGGAFMFLTGNVYGPEYLLDKDIVLVTVQYRLGPIGFLSTEDDVVPGNNGLKDQNLALKWVNKNIAAFGGNPNKITIAGMSAGGASVHYHVLSPLSRGLFQRAMAISGTALCPWAETESARQKTEYLAADLGCPTNDSMSMVMCLRERPAIQIVRRVHLFMPWRYYPFSPFGPIVEPPSSKAFIDKPIMEIIQNKEANDVPIIFSLTEHEGLYPAGDFFGKEDRVELFDTAWNSLIPNVLDFNYTTSPKDRTKVAETIRQKYLGDSKVADNKKGFVQMLSDRLFGHAIAKTAELHAANYISPVYAYKFNYLGDVVLSDLFYPRGIFDGVSHGDDVLYFLRLEMMPADGLSSRPMIKYMTGIWDTFASGDALPSNWTTVQKGLPQFTYLEIVSPDPSQNKVKNESDFAQRQFWESLGLREYTTSKTVRIEL